MYKIEFMKRPKTVVEIDQLINRTAQDEELLPVLPILDERTLSKLALRCGSLPALSNRTFVLGRLLVGHVLYHGGALPASPLSKDLPLHEGHINPIIRLLQKPGGPLSDPYEGLHTLDASVLGARYPEALDALRARLHHAPVFYQHVGEGTKPTIRVRRKYESFFTSDHWRSPTEYIEQSPEVHRGSVQLAQHIVDLLGLPYDSTRVKHVFLGTHPSGKKVFAVAKRFPEWGGQKPGALAEVKRAVDLVKRRIRIPPVIGYIRHGLNTYALFEHVEAPTVLELDPGVISRVVRPTSSDNVMRREVSKLRRTRVAMQLIGAGAKDADLTVPFINRKIREVHVAFQQAVKAAKAKGVGLGDAAERNALFHFSPSLKPIITFIDFEQVSVRAKPKDKGT